MIFGFQNILLLRMYIAQFSLALNIQSHIQFVGRHIFEIGKKIKEEGCLCACVCVWLREM